jgi:arylsulfatase A
MKWRPLHHRNLKMKQLAILGLILCLADISPAREPNVIFILADDLGYSELGCYGNQFNETPALDRLSQQGLRFTNAYAAAPVCSPYRAALMTGLHPARIGILDYLRPNSAFALSTSHHTLPEAFQDSGYATGFIGKWHLTGYKYHDAPHETRPTDHGFDSEIAGEVKGVGNGANFWPYFFRDQPIRWLDIKENKLSAQEYLVDRMNHEAIQFIEANQNKPFFLYLSHYATHSILNARPDKVQKYINKHPPGKSLRTNCYLCKDSGYQGDPLHHWAPNHNPHLAGMLESIDDGIRLITEKLDELGLADDTILIFTSDNGGETQVTSNAPLRGGKSQLYEGGIRIPLVIRWPGTIPAGTVSNQYTMNTDFFSTLGKACKLKTTTDRPTDGTNMLAHWKDPTLAEVGRDLHWHYPLDAPHFLGGVSSGAIRSGNWKLIEFFETDTLELYNLETDLGESTDVALKYPQLVQSLSNRLQSWQLRVGARTASGLKMASSGSAILEDGFSEDLGSDRWFFQKYWAVEHGELVRTEFEKPDARIFVKKPEYKDVVVKFDFQFRGAEDIRFLTGTPGKYNVVVHIHRDRFFIQTARDQTVPFFPAIHGMCRADFKENQWYTMTVEIVGDEVIAHVDRDSFVFGKHPIIDRDRDYFAFQVDKPGVAIDNVQLLQARKQKDWEERRGGYIARQEQRPPIRIEVKEHYEMLKMNVHDKLYRTDAKYRAIVHALDQQKQKQHELYPEVFSTIKQVLKPVAEYRRNLQENDERYKDIQQQINKAKRALIDYVLSRNQNLTELKMSVYEAEFEKARRKVEKHVLYQNLQRHQQELETLMKERYPKLYITDSSIQARQKKARLGLKSDLQFQQLIKVTGDLARAELDYRHAVNSELKELWKKLFQ